MPKSTKFEFESITGETLAGRLELPDSSIQFFAVFAHCFTCSKNVKAASRISRALAELGIAVLRFDFTGLGNSEGDFSNTNFSSNVEDLVAAAKAIEDIYEAPSLLIGHSLGGTAALIASAKIKSIKAVATIGSPADPEHVTRLFGSSLTEINETGEHEVQLAGRTFKIKKQFVDDVRNINVTDAINQLDCAVVIYHSPQDELVDINQARITYNRLKHPKNFVSLDGADHMLSSERDSDFVATTLAIWATRYLNLDLNFKSETEEPDRTFESGTVSPPSPGVVRIREVNGFTQRVMTSDHEFAADEPISFGGANKGMNPYELLLAALGTCTSMTIRMYAQHKGLSLDLIEVNLSQQQIHAKDCGDCESETGKVTKIQKEILLSGDLTDQQVNRINEIADRCPVHRTLMSEMKISSTSRLVSNPTTQN